MTRSIRTHCRLALDLFICDLPTFFDATDAAAVCNFLNTSLPDGSSAVERSPGDGACAGVAVAAGCMQHWPRVHEFVRTRARFLKAENVTKQGCDDGREPHVVLSRAPSRKRQRSPSKAAVYTEFVLKKVNMGSDDAISQVRVAFFCARRNRCKALKRRQVAKACGVSRHVFSRFGTKDKVPQLDFTCPWRLASHSQCRLQ